MSTIGFMIPLTAAHALLDEAVFARGAAAGFDAPGLEFQDSNSSAETQIACSIPMAWFILKELRRLGAPVATSKSPTRGRVKLPHLSWQRDERPYAVDGRFATRAAASFSRQLLPSNFSRWP